MDIRASPARPNFVPCRPYKVTAIPQIRDPPGQWASVRALEWPLCRAHSNPQARQPINGPCSTNRVLARNGPTITATDLGFTRIKEYKQATEQLSISNHSSAIIRNNQSSLPRHAAINGPSSSKTLSSIDKSSLDIPTHIACRKWTCSSPYSLCSFRSWPLAVDH